MTWVLMAWMQFPDGHRELRGWSEYPTAQACYDALPQPKPDPSPSRLVKCVRQ